MMINDTINKTKERWQNCKSSHLQNQLARAVGVSPNRIAEIVNNRRGITADTALRLALYFGNSPEFWMNLQSNYDLKMARRKMKPEDAKRIKARRAA